MQFAVQYPKAAVRYPKGPSIEERISLAIVGIQSKLFGLFITLNDLDERIIHTDVITV